MPLITKGLIRSYPRSLNAHAPMIISSGIALATLSKHLPVWTLWSLARNGYSAIASINNPLLTGWVGGFVIPMIKHGPNAAALYSSIIERVGYLSLALRFSKYILSAGILWPARAIAGILGIEWVNPHFLPSDLAYWAKSTALNSFDWAETMIESTWSFIGPQQLGWTAWLVGSVLGFGIYAYNCVGSEFVQLLFSIPGIGEHVLKPLGLLGGLVQEIVLLPLWSLTKWSWSQLVSEVGPNILNKLIYSWLPRIADALRAVWSGRT